MRSFLINEKKKFKKWKFEPLCYAFAGLNIIHRFVYLAVAIIGGEDILIQFTLLEPKHEQFAKNNVLMLRITLALDCFVSLAFSVMLIMGVRTRASRLVRVCYLYGMIVLVFSLLGVLPSFLFKLASGNAVDISRRVLSVIATMICAFQVYVVRQTYINFESKESTARDNSKMNENLSVRSRI